MKGTPPNSAQWDAIVIGSGLGGLGAAVLLAMEKGWKILVIEAHSQAGGFTHTFSRKGWEWDTGLHYVGGVQHEEGMLRRLFDRVTEKRLDWVSTGEIVDRFVISGKEFVYPAGRDAWKKAMLGSFPSESEAIDRYLELVDGVVRSAPRFFSEKAMSGLPAWAIGGFLRRGFLKFSKLTLDEVLRELSPDPLFRAVLAAQYGDHGLPPEKASFAIHAMVFAHYLRGAGYPVGGSGAIAPAIIPSIEAKGGRILLGSKVDEILLSGGSAVGVRCRDGQEYHAKAIISDVGLPNTLEMLPDGFRGRKKLEDIVDRVGLSSGHCCLHLGLNGTAEELGLPRANLWVYPKEDFDAQVRKYRENPGAEFPLVFISFPSAKDPDFTRRHPGKATIEMTIPARWEHFSKWEGSAPGAKGSEYTRLKEEISAKLLEILKKHMPGLEEKIAFSDLSTPLTTRYFCHYRRGEIYGLDHTPERFAARALKPRSPISGLWFSGQDVCTAGIVGALLGGALCASAISGRNLLNL